MKSLAKELKVPVIAVSQLNRSLDGAQQAAGDVGPAGVRRDRAGYGRHPVHLSRRVYNPDTQDKGVAEIIVGKQQRADRHGATHVPQRAHALRELRDAGQLLSFPVRPRPHGRFERHGAASSATCVDSPVASHSLSARQGPNPGSRR